MKAIVYTSNTGSTQKYAEMLSARLAVPAYSLKKARAAVKPGTAVLYLGWIRAGKIMGYAEAARNYDVSAVCAVGMGQTGTQVREVRAKNKIPAQAPLFTLQGNFDIKKLHGAYKVMMQMRVKTVGKALAKKAERTPEEDDMLEMMMRDGERVKAENLNKVLDWAIAQQ